MLRILLNKSTWKLTNSSEEMRYTVFTPLILLRRHFTERGSSTIYALSSGCYFYIFFCLFIHWSNFYKINVQCTILT